MLSTNQALKRITDISAHKRPGTVSFGDPDTAKL
jgi:hypothetical protein